jgi:hypothetical protein
MRQGEQGPIDAVLLGVKWLGTCETSDDQRVVLASVGTSIMMKKAAPASSPEAYVAALDGWRRALVEHLRSSTLAAVALDERIKWGHLVYFGNGPALLIRAEDERVLFGFWRGKRLLDIEPRLVRGGKYEMATLALTEGESIDTAKIIALVQAAAEFNRTLGDPTDAAGTT